MEKIRVGIDAEEFGSWGGGIDFIATIAEALEHTGKIQTYLMIAKDSVDNKVLRRVKCLVKSRCSIARYRESLETELLNSRPIVEGFKICSPNTIPVFYVAADNRLRRNYEEKKGQCALKNHMDIVFPRVHCRNSSFPVPQIAYIFDFQHKYIPELFTEEERRLRDRNFERQLKNAHYIIVNAADVKKDIRKFYPQYDNEIIVLPFRPFQKPDLIDVDLDQYDLPQRYYMIANQFWQHKDHRTAFEALERAYCAGHKDMHIVCTGKMQDQRNPDYIPSLKRRILELKCKDNIHLLGFLPKDDQIAIMNRAAGLIQPTWFEGGPGGGAVYNALCLGITCLVSDIPVNREITGYENVYFFEKENPKALSELMIRHFSDKRMDDETVDRKIADNKKEYCDYIYSKINEVIECYHDRKT